jgi:hypothetical protein
MLVNSYHSKAVKHFLLIETKLHQFSRYFFSYCTSMKGLLSWLGLENSQLSTFIYPDIVGGWGRKIPIYADVLYGWPLSPLI